VLTQVQVSSNENLDEAKFLESYHKPIPIHGTIAKVTTCFFLSITMCS